MTSQRLCMQVLLIHLQFFGTAVSGTNHIAGTQCNVENVGRLTTDVGGQRVFEIASRKHHDGADSPTAFGRESTKMTSASFESVGSGATSYVKSCQNVRSEIKLLAADNIPGEAADEVSSGRTDHKIPLVCWLYSASLDGLQIP